jgi:hypothetical protein
MNAANSWEWPEARPWQRGFLIAGAVGLAACAVGAFIDTEQFFHSYLLGLLAWLSIALGSLALWMLHNLTGGWWGLVIRRILEAAARTLPLLLLLFLPMVLGIHDTYPWARPEGAEEIGSRAAYLNYPFFLIRAGFYFAVWLGTAFLLDRWSVLHDRTGDERLVVRAQHFSGPGLVLYGLTVTFAGIDWIMSLEPHWYSTIFGAIIATSQLLPALGMAIALASCLVPQATRAPAGTAVAQLATPDVWNDLGNLLLAMVMLWTYMMFSQLLLIWSGNLPEEIIWYLIRAEGGWQAIGIGLAVFYFALPFVLLLSRDIKRRPQRLRVVAISVVLMSLVHQFWLIVPSFSPRQLWLHWMDVAAVVGVGGLWLAYLIRQVQARPVIPVHQPLAEEGLSHA